MKKKHILFWIFIFFGFYAHAQNNSKIKFGVKGGVNFANQYIQVAQFSGNSAFISSLQIAGIIDFPIKTKFSLQTGISLSGKGAKYDYSGSGTDSIYGAYHFTYKGTSRILYLESKINGIYKINRLFFGAGIYLSYAISGKKDIITTAYNDLGAINSLSQGQIKFGNHQDDESRRGDYGLNILSNYQLNSNFNLGISYELGLCNLSPVKGQKGRNSVISITTTYFF